MWNLRGLPLGELAAGQLVYVGVHFWKQALVFLGPVILLMPKQDVSGFHISLDQLGACTSLDVHFGLHIGLDWLKEEATS